MEEGAALHFQQASISESKALIYNSALCHSVVQYLFICLFFYQKRTWLSALKPPYHQTSDNLHKHMTEALEQACVQDYLLNQGAAESQGLSTRVPKEERRTQLYEIQVIRIYPSYVAS